MKQYKNESQTAKLIELGFEKPKSSVECELPKGDWRIGAVGIRKAYSIGELLSFLPDVGVTAKRLEFDGFHWFVDWDSFDKIRQTVGVELVDALYDMCIDIKEERVI